MKIEVQAKTVTVKLFPKLMIHNSNGLAIFFESKEVGQVLGKGDSRDAVYITDTWNVNNFTDLDPLTVITLQNDSHITI